MLSQKIFEDHSTDGRMNTEEFKGALRALRYMDADDEEGRIMLTDEEADAAFVRLDTNESGFLELKEFQVWWRTETATAATNRGSFSEARTQALRFQDEDEEAAVKGAVEELSRATSGRAVMTKEDFHRHCYRRGYCLTLTELDEAFDQLDKDGSGVVETSEFLRWFRVDDRFAHLPRDKDQSVRDWVNWVAQYFGQYDPEWTGVLSKEKFTEMFYSEGFRENLTENIEVEELFEKIDVSGDGRISFNEFLTWYYDNA